MTQPIDTPHSPPPGVPQTNHKAWSAGITGSLTTLLMFVVSDQTALIPMPDLEDAQRAAIGLLSGVVGVAVGLVTHFTRNLRKEG